MRLLSASGLFASLIFDNALFQARPRTGLDERGHVGGTRILPRVAEQQAIRIPIETLRALHRLLERRTPLRLGDDRRNKAHRETFFGGEYAAFHQNGSCHIRADTGGEAPRAERDAKPPA